MKIFIVPAILAILAYLSSTHADGVTEENACMLPPSPTNGQYNLNQLENPDPAKAYEFLALNYSCNPGYETFGNRVRLCIKGTWSSDEPKCLRVCKLFKSPSVEYNCVEGLDLRPCHDSEPEGTLIRPKCSKNHYFPGDLPYMHCVDARWDHYPTCQPECGIFPTDELAYRPFITPSGLARVPWFATIYKKSIDKPYSGWCIATLITKNIVLSAAQCFWKESSAKDFAVAVSKQFYRWDAIEDRYAQKSDVADIIIHPDFASTTRKDVQNNIAVVKLATEFTFGPDVRPVCLDFDMTFERQQLQKKAIGWLPLWRAATQDQLGDRGITVLELLYTPTEECTSLFNGDSKKFISADKFCAAIINTESIGQCRAVFIRIGNSGGGITYPEQYRGVTRHYLRGIATLTSEIDKPCANNTIAIFTQITKHENFIRQFI